MKIVRTIVILIVLFGLPAGSWYFLKDGFNWRKAKMEQLQKKEKFFDAFDFSADDKNRLFEEMTYRTSLIKLNSDITKRDNELIKQFKNTHTFMFFVLTGTNSKLKDNFSSKVPLRYIQASNTSPKNFEYNNAQYMIVDTAGYIRNFYEWSDDDKMVDIVEDLAVILPKRKTPDISTEGQNIQK